MQVGPENSGQVVGIRSLLLTAFSRKEEVLMNRRGRRRRGDSDVGGGFNRVGIPANGGAGALVLLFRLHFKIQRLFLCQLQVP